jgi:hypothetical protein
MEMPMRFCALISLMMVACGDGGQRANTPHAPPFGPPPIPAGWTDASPESSWYDLQPTWSKGMEAVVSADDPHRKIRLRVGCAAAGSPIGVGMANLPKPAKNTTFRFETLGNQQIHEIRGSGQAEVVFKDSYQLLSSMRMPGVTQLTVSASPITYGLFFNVRDLEAILSRDDVQACAW